MEELYFVQKVVDGNADHGCLLEAAVCVKAYAGKIIGAGTWNGAAELQGVKLVQKLHQRAVD